MRYLFKYKMIIGILLLLVSYMGLRSQCIATDYVQAGESITVVTSGNNTSYTTTYYLVGPAPSTTVLDMNSTGVFTVPLAALAGETYQVHILNYNPLDAPDPIPAIGEDVTTIGSIDPGCYNSTDFLTEAICFIVKECLDSRNLCSGDALTVLSTGTNTAYTTLFQMVDLATNTIVSENTDGVFTTYIATATPGSYEILTLNYNPLDPPIPLPTVGDDPTTIGSTTMGCYDLNYMTEVLCINMLDCQCVVSLSTCVGQPLTFNYISDNPAFTTTFQLVDAATGLIVSENSTGDFTSYISTAAAGNYEMLVLNYDPLDPPAPLPTVGDNPNIIGTTTAGTYSLTYREDKTCITLLIAPTAAIDPTTATVCMNGSTTLNLTGSPSATVSYTTTPPGTSSTIGLTNTGTATLNTNALTTTTTYTLTSVSYAGSPACPTPLTDASTVTVLPNPTASISGNNSICGGTSADVTFTGTPNAVVTYQINGGANQTVTLDDTGTFVLNSGPLASTTVYTITSVTLTSGTTTCTATVFGLVIINITPPPAASITGSATICSGSTATINFAGTPNSIVTFTDQLGATQTVTLNASGAGSFTSTALTATTNTFTLVSIVGAPPSSCPGTAVGSAIVTTVPLPTAVVEGGAIICTGDVATITITGTPNGTVTYNVDGGASTTIVLDAAGLATLASGSFTTTTTYNLVSVLGTGTPLCTAPLTSSTTVTVNTIPVAPTAGPSVTICELGASTQVMTATPPVTPAGTTIEWFDAADGGNSLGTGNNVNTTQLTAGVYTYYAESVGPAPTFCRGPRTPVVFTITSPTPAPIVTNATVCQGASTTLTSILASGCPAGSLAQPQAGIVGTAATTFVAPATTGSATGSYTAVYTNSNDLVVSFPALPAGASVTNIATTISGVTFNGSFLSELRVRVTNPLGTVFNDIQPSTTSTGGTLTNQSFSPTGGYGTTNPTGNWIFSFRETFNDSANAIDFNVSNITITVTYVIGTPNWYLTSTGGTSFASGISMNPVTTAGSGVTDTNTPGVFTYYVQCGPDGSCALRTPATLSIYPTAVVAATSTCPTTTVAADGTITVTEPAPVAGFTWQYAISAPGGITPLAFGTNPNFTGLIGGSYKVFIQAVTDPGGVAGPTSCYTPLSIDLINTAPSIANSYSVCQNGTVPAGQGLVGGCGTTSLPVSVSIGGLFDVSSPVVPVLIYNLDFSSIPTAATITNVEYTGFSGSTTDFLSEINFRIIRPGSTNVSPPGTINPSFASGVFEIDMGNGGVPAMSLPGGPGNFVVPAGSTSLYNGTSATGIWQIVFDDEFPFSTTTNTVDPSTFTLTISYSLPVTWWDATTGGTQIGAGSPFNPVGTALIPNTSTPGCTTIYAQCGNGVCAPRTPTNFCIFPNPTIVETHTCPTLNVDGTVNADGSITITPPAPVAGFSYQYAISEVNTTTLGTYGTDNIFSDLAPGTYTVAVTSESNTIPPAVSPTSACVATMLVSLQVPSPPTDPVTGLVCEGETLELSVLCPPAGGSVVQTNTSDFNIADNSTVLIPVNIAGVPFGATITDVNVSMNIYHSFASDLDVSLINPSAVSTWLSQDDGGGNNLGSCTGTSPLATTCGVVYTFDQAGAVLAFPATDPIPSGTYIPEGNLAALNGTSTINGLWQLSVADDAGGDTGSVKDVTITIAYSLPNSTTVWYATGNSTTAIGNDVPFSPVDLTPGEHTVYAACEITGQCPGERIPVTYEVLGIDPGDITGIGPFCQGDIGGFSSIDAIDLGNSGGLIEYQWEQSSVTTDTPCGSIDPLSWTEITGATLSTYTPTYTDGLTYYYFRRKASLTKDGVTCSDYTGCQQVIIYPSPIIEPITDQTFCDSYDFAGLTTDFPIVTVPTGITTYYFEDFATLNEALPGEVITQTTTITVYAETGNALCTITEDFTIYINNVTPGTLSQDQSICYGQPASLISTSAGSTTSGGTITYQWNMSTLSATGPWTDLALDPLTTAYDPGSPTETTYYQVLAISTLNGVACQAETNTVTITVVPAPTVVVSTDITTVCASNVVNITATVTNASSGSWDDGGAGGSFGDAFALITTYTPPTGMDCATVTLTFTTDNGDGTCPPDTDSIDITVDNTAPVIVEALGELDATIECSDATAIEAALASMPTATDGCDAPMINLVNSVTTPDPTCDYLSSTVLTYNATDACGNTSADFTITVTTIDTTAPILSSTPANTTVECYSEVPGDPGITASDLCDPNVLVTFSQSNPAGCAGNDVITNTWTATDCAGNSVTHTQEVTILNVTPPVLSAVPATTIVSCLSDVPGDQGVTATDNCGGSLTVNFSQVPSSTCAGSGYVTNTWTVTDCAGNSNSQSQVVIINDTSDPVLSATPGPLTVECVNEVPGDQGITASDNCGEILTVTFSQSTPPTCPGNGVVLNTWSVEDCAGNETVHTQLITIDDNTAPLFSATPADVTVTCVVDVPGSQGVTASDNCGGTANVTFVQSPLPNCPGSGTVTNTWSTSDCAGNATSYTQTVTISDTDGPILSATPSDLTVTCSSAVPGSQGITATDNCGGNITVNFSQSALPPCSGSGTVTNTWTATDCAGNITTHIQTVLIDDNTGPVLSATPSDLTVTCSSAVPGSQGITATDNCGGNITVNFSQSALPSCSGSGTVTNTWTATDCAGNITTHIQTVTIDDNTGPILSATPSDLTVTCSSAVPGSQGITATDNCGGNITVNFSQSALPSCSGSGTVTNTWTATDCAGNITTYVQTVTIDDNTGPILSATPADVTVDCIAQIPGNSGITATDNCGGIIAVNFIQSSLPGCGVSGSVTNTWSATDCAGNNTTYTQTVTVTGGSTPVFPMDQSSTVACLSDAVTPAPPATVTDGCGNVVVPSGPTMGTNPACSGSGTKTYTWTYTLCSGVTDTYVYTYNIVDNIDPVLSATPVDITVACASQVPGNQGITASDNCGGNVSVNFSQSALPACGVSGSVTNTWSATDCAGNVTSYSQIVSVTGGTAPILPDDQFSTVACLSNATLPATPVSIMDACGNILVPSGPVVSADPTCSGLGTKTYTWTYTLCSGTTDTYVYTYTIDDNIDPILSAMPADITVSCASQVPGNQGVTATDNCGGNITVDYSQSALPACASSGSVTNTWTATDCAGNMVVHTQVVTITNSSAPSLSTTSQVVTINCGEAVPAPLVVTASGACGSIPVTMNESSDLDACGNGTIIRTYTATGCDDTSASISQTIYIIDDTAPIIEAAPNDITVGCGQVPPSVTLSVTDGCDGNNTVSATESSSYDANGNHVIVRTWSYTDCAGNIAIPVNQIITETGCCTPPSIADLGDQITCAGTSVSIGVGPNEVMGTGPFTYSWSPANLVSCPTCSSTSFTGNVSATLTLTISNGCGSYSEDVLVTVNSGSPFELGSNLGICSDDLPYTLAGPSGYETYIWSMGFEQLGTSQNFVATEYGIYQLITYDENGCSWNDVIQLYPVTTCESASYIVDPCTCLNNATNDINGQFSEGVTIYSGAGETWTVVAASNFYLTSSPAPPLAPLPLLSGTVLPETGLGVYSFDGIVIDGIAWSITVTNGSETLIIGSMCAYPNPSIVNLASEYCSTDPDQILSGLADMPGTGVFLVDGVEANMLSISNLSIGTHSVEYLFTATDGCTQSSGIMVVSIVECGTNNELGNLVWIDENGNGTYEVGEALVPGVIVNLYGANGQLVASTITDNNGYYEFNVPDGIYYIEFEIPNGFNVTAANAGGETVDSDVLPNGATALFQISNGNAPSIGLGLVPVSGPVCNDFAVSYEVVCNDGLNNEKTYTLYIYISGGDPGNGGYFITSSHQGGFNGIFYDNLLVEGPFPAGAEGTGIGFAYNITVANHPSCSEIIEESIVECIPTPLELVDFSGVVQEHNNLLVWQSANEVNTDYFILSRSLDGQTFEPLTMVDAVGNSVQTTSYDYIDTDVRAGVYYYQLEIYDLDGSVQKSQVITLVRSNEMDIDLEISPIPAQSNINVSWTGLTLDERVIGIFDVAGKLLQKQNVVQEQGFNKIVINIDTLPTGTYFLVMEEGGKRFFKRFVKE